MASKDTSVFHTKDVNVDAAKSITSYQYHDQQRSISSKKSKISTVNEAFLYTNDLAFWANLTAISSKTATSLHAMSVTKPHSSNCLEIKILIFNFQLVRTLHSQSSVEKGRSIIRTNVLGRVKQMPMPVETLLEILPVAPISRNVERAC